MHRLGRVQGEPAGEHRQAAQNLLLVAGQEVVAPVEGGLEGLVSGRTMPHTAGEDTDAGVEPAGHVLQRDEAGVGGGQLEGEG